MTSKSIIVTWLHGDEAYGRTDATYNATLICVDPMGTATFKRDEDGFVGVAGAGCWKVVDAAPAAVKVSAWARKYAR